MGSPTGGKKAGHKTLYEVLELDHASDPPPDAAAVKKAYRRLALRWHPDKTGGRTTDEFREISNAYEILSDEVERQQYDARLVRRYVLMCWSSRVLLLGVVLLGGSHLVVRWLFVGWLVGCRDKMTTLGVDMREGYVVFGGGGGWARGAEKRPGWVGEWVGGLVGEHGE